MQLLTLKKQKNKIVDIPEIPLFSENSRNHEYCFLLHLVLMCGIMSQTISLLYSTCVPMHRADVDMYQTSLC